MKVAVKYGAIHHEQLVDDDGNLVVKGGGMTLVRRLLNLFDGAQLIGPQPRHCNGFEMVPLEFVDADHTVVINMDVIDSIAVFQTLHSTGAEPKIMNFEWINPSTYHHPVNFAAMGLSFALFPTFCSSERTAGEVREVVHFWTVSRLASTARIAWDDLGVDAGRVQPRQHTEVPVVLYPAIYMYDRKKPQQFFDIVSNVAKRVPIHVEARLTESHLVSDLAMELSRQRWSSVGPLTARKDDYWSALSRTTAFVATAEEEAYGLEYVEALAAGVIGIFPDRPWAHALVPEGYPLFYRSLSHAEELLVRTVTNPAVVRSELDACAGGSFDAWVREHHVQKEFEQNLVKQMREWFGE